MGVVIVGHRQGEVFRAAGEEVVFEADAAFTDGPAIVLPVGTPGWLGVDSLAIEIAHVLQIKVAAPLVESKYPSIAKNLRSDLWTVSIELKEAKIVGYAV